MTTRTRTRKREQFLADNLARAMEHGGYGFPTCVEYYTPDGKPGEWFAVIEDRYTEEGEEEYGTTWRVDLETVAKGFGVIRRWHAGDGTHDDDWKPARWVKDLLLADRTNGADGDIDVIGALAVLECALFGKVVYA